MSVPSPGDTLDVGGFPSGPRPRSLVLPLPTSRRVSVVPDVFVTSPDGAASFCAFDSRSEGHQQQNGVETDVPPSPSAPDFAELERALAFLQEAVKVAPPFRRRHSANSGPAIAGVVMPRRQDEEPSSSSSIVAASPLPADARRASTARPVLDAHAQRSSLSGSGKTLKSRASLVFKKAFFGQSGNVAAHHAAAADEPPVAPGTEKASVELVDELASTTSPVTNPTKAVPKPKRAVLPTAGAHAKSDVQSSMSRLFNPSLFFSAERQRLPQDGSAAEADRLPRKRFFGPSFMTRSRKGSSKDKSDTENLRSAPLAKTPQQSLRRRPFSVLALRNTSASSTSVPKPLKSPSLPSSTPRTSFSTASQTSPSTRASSSFPDSLSVNSTATYSTSPSDLMTPPLSSKTARLDSFHFDQATLFDALTFEMR